MGCFCSETAEGETFPIVLKSKIIQDSLLVIPFVLVLLTYIAVKFKEGKK